MTLLVLGLVVFLGVHTLTMLRAPRAALIGRIGAGRYKGAYSLVAAAGLVLIVLGYGSYRAEGWVPLWEPPVWGRHSALLLMWFAFVALAANGRKPGLVAGALRHPMLVGVKLWALAHLLANGDLGSLLLFGSFLAWAVADRIAVKRRGDMGAARAGFGRSDAIALGGGTVAYVAMLFLHPVLIGVSVIGR